MSRCRWRFVGDLHVKSLRAWLDKDAAVALHAREMREQLALAKRDGCTHIAILGDVFDDPFPDQDDQLVVMQALAAARDFRVLVFTGNHDIHDASHSSLKLLKKLPEAGALTHVTFVTEPQIIRWGGLRVAVVPWSKHFPDLRKAGSADLVLFHDAVVGAKGDSGHAIPLGKALHSSVLRGLTAVGGHLHLPQRSGNVWFPGTYCHRSFREAGEKSVLTLDVRDGQMKFFTDRVKRPTWRMETVVFDPKNPPSCDERDVLYRVDISRGVPGPKWMVNHPQVVRAFGGRPAQRGKDAQDRRDKIASILERGSADAGSDSKLLQRYLINHAKVDALSRAAAMRIHERLSKETA